MKTLLLLMAFLSITSHARWATRNDINFIALRSDTILFVKKDGRFIMQDTTLYEILKEEGKAHFSLFKVPFSSKNMNVEILEAKVINGSEETIVSKEMIVERAVAEKNGISSLSEMQIAFPRLQVGTKISLKFKMSTKAAPLPGHFSLSVPLGIEEMIETGSFIIKSEIPLEAKINDPHNAIDLSVTQKEHTLIVAKIKKPLLSQLIQEEGTIPEDKLTTISISSDKNWDNIGKFLKTSFDKALSSTLPSELESAVKSAEKLSSLQDKVNFLVGHITRNYNYLGDWRGPEAGFTPNSLDKIVAMKYGDCKDFASLLTAMLRNLNISADIALVHRSNPQTARILKTDLPSFGLFNHAIVRVMDKEKVYWVDPTNKTSYGLFHRPDIAAKWALALDGTYELEKIPFTNTGPESLTIKSELIFDKANSAKANSSLELKGALALMFTELYTSKGKQILDKAFVKMFEAPGETSFEEISPYEMKENTYKDIDFKANYVVHNVGANDKKLLALPRLDTYLAFLGHDFSKWDGDLFLDVPLAMNRTVFYKNIFAVEKLPKGCDIKSPWVDISRKLLSEKEGIKLVDSLTIKTPFIFKKDFSSTDFQLLQGSVSSCFVMGIPYGFGKGGHQAASIDLSSLTKGLQLPQRLEKRIEIALSVLNRERKDLSYEDVLQLIKLNIAEDKKHGTSYVVLANIVLGMGYYNGNNYSSESLAAAEQVLDSGIQLLPTHQGLLLRKAYVATITKRKSVVEEYLQKALAVGPVNETYSLLSLYGVYQYLNQTDKAMSSLYSALSFAKKHHEEVDVHFRLGSAHSGTNNEKCIEHYGKAIKLNKQDAWARINVTYCYLELKRYNEAIAVAKEAQEISPSGMGAHVLSDALLKRGNWNLLDKEFEKAAADFKEALLTRKTADGYLGLASAMIGSKNEAQAEKYILEGEELAADKLWYSFHAANLFPKTSPYFLSFINRGDEMAKVEPNVQKVASYYAASISKFWNGKDDDQINPEKAELYANLMKAREKSLTFQERDEFNTIFSLGYIYMVAAIKTAKVEWKDKAMEDLRRYKALYGEKSKGSNYYMNLLSGKNRMPASQ